MDWRNLLILAGVVLASGALTGFLFVLRQELSGTPGDLVPADETQFMRVKVYFANIRMNPESDCTKSSPVTRNVAKSERPMEAALAELVKGPTAEEHQAGYRSFFSSSTAGILKGVKMGDDGVVFVNLRDIRQIIPNASTSCGAVQLISELGNTLMQFSGVTGAIYAIDEDPAAFYEWIQVGCGPANRFCDKKPFEDMNES